jgi:hypothetical protein
MELSLHVMSLGGPEQTAESKCEAAMDVDMDMDMDMDTLFSRRHGCPAVTCRCLSIISSVVTYAVSAVYRRSAAGDV